MNPLIPIAIAALVGGTALNVSAQNKVRKEQSRAYRRYADRSDARTAEAAGLFDRSLAEQDVNKANEAIDTAADAKVARVEDLVQSDAYVDPMIPGIDRAPAVIKGQASADLADEIARARAEIQAMATLEGYSTRTFDRGLQLGRVMPELGNLGIFAQGDRNILDADMVDASRAGDKRAMAGDVLTMIGSLMMMGAGSGAGAGAAKVTGGAGQGLTSSLAASAAASSPYMLPTPKRTTLVPPLY